jgi:2-iminobutanoate/2-iminopropanoate deaminase
MPKIVITSSGAPVTGFTDRSTPSPIVQAIRFGNMLFVSGQGPLDPETKQVVDGGIEAQARRTLANLRSVLAAAGADFSNVVNMRVILRDVGDFKQFNEIFRQEIGGEKVTRTCVGGTPHRDGVNVEIDCVAMFDNVAPRTWSDRPMSSSPDRSPRNHGFGITLPHAPQVRAFSLSKKFR